MVKEVRKIIFSADELFDAFRAYARVTPQFLPAGTLIACTPQTDDSVRLNMELQYGDSVQKAEFTYKGLDVLRPVILYCIENNIMLPRDGRKAYKTLGGEATLIVELDMERDVPATVTPMMGEHLQRIATVAAADKSTCVHV